MKLLVEAKRGILDAIDDQDRTGICVVATSRKLDRVGLIIEVLDACAGEPNPEQDEFRSLYVCKEVSRLEQIKGGMRRRRSGSRHSMRPLRDYVYSAGQSTVGQPRELSLASLPVLRELAPRFPPDSLELLVLEELEPGEMASILPFINRAKPLFTLLLTRREPPAESPWRELLGEPLVIRGPEQMPPREKSDAAESTP